MADRYVSIGGNQDIIGYDDAEFDYAISTDGVIKSTATPTNPDDMLRLGDVITPIMNNITLTPQAAAPTTPTNGMIVCADDATWDPLGLTLGRPYLVFYSGAAWRRLDA